jgi:glycosyltransferase involved in cell wall biosynthesis
MDHLTKTASRALATGKKILLVSPYWLEDHRWMISSVKLSELWQRMGYHVTVVCMGSKNHTETMSETLTVHYRKDFFFPDPLNYGIAFGFSKYVEKVARELKPDHVIINKVLFWSSLAIFRLKKMGYPVLLVTDALVGITWKPRHWYSKIIMSLGAWTVGKRVLRASSRIVFFHPQPQEVLRRLKIDQKSIVIPTGIDPSAFSTGETTAPLRITYVGRLESVKGVDDFLAAAKNVKEKHPEIAIQVVGWYKDRHDLVEKYQSLVTFTGLSRDIPTVLRDTDIFVLPSYSEGLSNALMEAMASGCACIATEVGGNTFLIENGVSGLLFKSGDTTTLQNHLETLINDASLRKRMGSAARTRIEEQFSWEHVMKQYAQVFQS